MIFELKTVPNPILRQPSQRVLEVNKKIRTYLDIMLQMMYEFNGIGIAAVQLGLRLQLVTIDVRGSEQGKHAKNTGPLKLINPYITAKSDKLSSYEEGCLSIPNVFGEVTRPKEVEVEYTDEYGKLRKITTGGILAVCLQHEIDHLNGTLFTDHVLNK